MRRPGKFATRFLLAIRTFPYPLGKECCMTSWPFSVGMPICPSVGGVMRITSTSCEFVMPTTGGPMCPLGGDTVRFPPIYGEFVMSATGGHMGPPLRRYGRTCKIEYSLRSPQGRPPFHSGGGTRDILPFVRRGGPVCPPGGDAVRFPPIYGEFAMPTTGRHMGLPLRRYRKVLKAGNSLRFSVGNGLARSALRQASK